MSVSKQTKLHPSIQIVGHLEPISAHARWEVVHPGRSVVYHRTNYCYRVLKLCWYASAHPVGKSHMKHSNEGVLAWWISASCFATHHHASSVLSGGHSATLPYFWLSMHAWKIKNTCFPLIFRLSTYETVQLTCVTHNKRNEELRV